MADSIKTKIKDLDRIVNKTARNVNTLEKDFNESKEEGPPPIVVYNHIIKKLGQIITDINAFVNNPDMYDDEFLFEWIDKFENKNKAQNGRHDST